MSVTIKCFEAGHESIVSRKGLSQMGERKPAGTLYANLNEQRALLITER